MLFASIHRTQKLLKSQHLFIIKTIPSCIKTPSYPVKIHYWNNKDSRCRQGFWYDSTTGGKATS